MPAANLRVNVVLEKPLYEVLRRWARRDGVSLSLKVRDLVKEAFEREEDRVLATFAEVREQSFERKKALAHARVWTHLRRPRR